MNVALYMKQHKSAVFSLLVLLTILLSLNGTYAFAADLDTNIISGSSSQFNQYIGDWFTSMQSAARAISTIMVVLGGINIALNLESANKTVWSICLGAGLALNIGSVLTQAWTPVASLDPSAIDFHIDIPSGSEFSVDSIMKFPEVYRKYTVAGANYMMGPATKLLLVLTAIGAMIKLSLDLVSGDKIRYFTELMLETGVYFFLITNWYGGDNGTSMNIMGNLCAGFEELGQKAGGGQTFTDSINGGLVPNDILGNSAKIFLKSVENGVFDITSPIASIMTGLMLIVILILLILTGIEIFMARIEFWTLAMATIPLIPFAALPQTRFLFSSALNGMMNLAIKVSVIAFISTVSTKILTDYITEFAKISQDQMKGNFALYIQALLVAALLYLIIKKIPDLVSSLLSGTPSLNGASMKQMATQAANTAAKAGAAVATGGASMAKAAVGGAMQGGFKAAGAAAAGGKGTAGQMLSGALGAVGGGLNAGAGSLMSGGANLAKQALLGGAGGAGGKGGAGGAGGGGGLLAPFQRGAELGKAFDNRDPKSNTVLAGHKTATDHIDSFGDKLGTIGGKITTTVSKVKNEAQSSFNAGKVAGSNKTKK